MRNISNLQNFDGYKDQISGNNLTGWHMAHGSLKMQRSVILNH